MIIVFTNLLFKIEINEIDRTIKVWKENTGDWEYNWGPFGPVKVTVCPTFSGWQSDYCINGMPVGRIVITLKESELNV